MSMSMFATVDEYRESLKVDNDKQSAEYRNPLEYLSGVIRKQSGPNASDDKPIVHYSVLIHRPEVNYRAVIVPIDHPAIYLNGQRVTTSTIISVDDNGKDFESLNTRYVFQQQAATDA